VLIIALLFPNSRLVLCQIFSYDFPKIRNLPNFFLKSFENVASGSFSGLSSVLRLHQHSIRYMGDSFYRSKDPTNSIKVLKEHIVHRRCKNTISTHINTKHSKSP